MSVQRVSCGWNLSDQTMQFLFSFKMPLTRFIPEYYLSPTNIVGLCSKCLVG